MPSAPPSKTASLVALLVAALVGAMAASPGCSNVGFTPGSDDDGATGDDDGVPTDDDVGPGDDDTAPTDDDTGPLDDDGVDDDGTPSGAGDLQADPATIDFGNVDPGDVLTRNLVLANAGDETLDITSILVDGDAEFDYAGPPLPLALSAGSPATFVVIYSPTADGSHDADLVIQSDDPDEGTVRVALEGTAGDGGPSDDDVTPPDDDVTPPPDDDATPDTPHGDIQVTPTSLDFGNVTGSAPPRTFQIRNVGDGTLSSISVSFSGLFPTGGHVSFTGVTASLAPGATTTVTASWAPGDITLGLADGCLDLLDGSTADVHSNSPGESVVQVQLSGCCDGSGSGACTAADIFDLFFCLASATDFLDMLGCLFGL